MNRFALIVIASAIFAPKSRGVNFGPAARATNEVGLDLYRESASDEKNLCLSPYSISCTLAMALAGADGTTRREIARVLHLDPEAESDSSFWALRKSLARVGPEAARIAQEAKKNGAATGPITIAVANRLFLPAGNEFRSQFLSQVKEQFGVAPKVLDFRRRRSAATREINAWVARQTRDRIRDLIPQPLDAATRLVLVNAVYFRAPWSSAFDAGLTALATFHVGGGNPRGVLMMLQSAAFRYAKHDTFSAVALPYKGSELQFVILLPDRIDGLRALEKKLTAETLLACTTMEKKGVVLYLPKFQVEPPTIELAGKLQALGMKAAFDRPPGSANFDRMAAPRPNDRLAISDVFQKTFISVDERGTEATAAAAMAEIPSEGPDSTTQPKPVEVKVDRPFIYLIQHVPSGACLFLGRVTDPR
ncbi:MAG: serpin family protein [Chthoniobacterales bacterium]